jgi:hypothetical protein
MARGVKPISRALWVTRLIGVPLTPWLCRCRVPQRPPQVMIGTTEFTAPITDSRELSVEVRRALVRKVQLSGGREHLAAPGLPSFSARPEVIPTDS